MIVWCSAATSFKKKTLEVLLLFLPREITFSMWKMFPLIFFQSLPISFCRHSQKKVKVKKTSIFSCSFSPGFLPDPQTFKQPTGAQQLCHTSVKLLAERMTLDGMCGSCKKEKKNNGVAFPLPLHSSESWCGNTPLP